MHQVDRFTVGKTSRSGGEFRIHELGMACPKCGVSGWFDFNEEALSRQDVREAPRTKKCAACKSSLYFYLLAQPAHDPGWLWVHPSPDHAHTPRGDVAAALARVHEALGQAYEGAASVLASGHASPAATEARRTLEGLVKHLLEDAGFELPPRPVLAQLLDKLTEHVDLAKPITETAEAVREGGNLGAHYDTKSMATPAMAREALGLVEAFVDYILILPSRVERLRRLLDEEERLGGEPESAPPAVNDEAA